MNYITDISQADAFFTDLGVSDILALDIESTSLDPWTGELLLVQIKLNDNIYVFDARKLGIKNIKYIIELIKAGNVEVVIHNAIFDVYFLDVQTGIRLENVFCTQVAEAIITGGEQRFTKLNNLITKYLPKTGKEIDKETRELFINLPQSSPITQEMLIYSAQDVDYLIDISEKQRVIISDEGMDRILELEMGIVPAVALMRKNGVILDSDAWLEIYEESVENKEKYTNELKQQVLEFVKNNSKGFVILKSSVDETWNKVQNRIEKYKSLDDEYVDIPYGGAIKVDNAYLLFEYMLIPVNSLGKIKALKQISLDGFELVSDVFLDEFNVDSPHQLKRALNVAGVMVENTGEKILKRERSKDYLLDSQKQMVRTILDLKEYSKRVSSFGENTLEHISRVTGRIHADVNQIGTRTGRFSYSNPNLQQIPKEEMFRKCFIAPEGSVIITSDYSQQELRLVGDLSQDEVIIDAYKHGKDIHAVTASALFDVPIEAVTHDQRGDGKTLNFQTIYGATKWGISATMEISVEEAEEFLNRYFGKYKALAEFKKMVEDIVWENLYSTTPYGRKRFFKFDEKEFFKDEGEPGEAQRRRERKIAAIRREGFNHPIQGGSADMLKQALSYLYYNNPFGEIKFKVIMLVHDEIVVEVEKDIAEQAQEFIISCMNRAGNEMMEFIEAETDSHIEKYWSKE